MEQWLKKYKMAPFIFVCSLVVAISMVIISMAPSTNMGGFTVDMPAFDESGEDVMAEPDGEAILSEYSREVYAVSAEERQYVIDAAELLNGTVIEPGATFSFNESISSALPEANTFNAADHQAMAFEDDSACSLCQVATAFYYASLSAGCSATERYSHSNTVNYAPIGFDTLIVYSENYDVKMTNPSAQPMTVKAEVVSNILTVRILGMSIQAGETYELIANALSMENDTESLAAAGIPLMEGYTVYTIDTFRRHYVNDEMTTEQISSDLYYAPTPTQ